MVIVNGDEIVLSGTVGEMFWEDGFTAAEVITALAQIGREREVTVRLNSGGGIATEGAAIHSALSQHKGGVNMVIEGVAASAASLIAMAGDTITMRPGSIMMIHDPAGFTMGDAAAHQKTIEALNALGDAYADVYADRSGKPAQDMRELMRAETWMTAQQAIDAGFADALAADNDNEPEAAAFAYGLYANAPETFVALANARGWKARAMMAAPAAPHKQKEPLMADKNQIADETQGTAEPAVLEDAILAPEVCAEIVDICAEAGAPAMAAALIREGLTSEQAKVRAEQAKHIRALVDVAAGKFACIEASLADEFIGQGYSVEKARAALFEKIVATQSPEVSPHVTAAVTQTDAKAALAKSIARINARSSAA